jgi:hypothetical protein
MAQPPQLDIAPGRVGKAVSLLRIGAATTVGEPDAAIGAKANEAIADFQEKNGMPSTAAPRSRRWRRRESNADPRSPTGKNQCYMV